jgi:hypothetical protein
VRSVGSDSSGRCVWAALADALAEKALGGCGEVCVAFKVVFESLPEPACALMTCGALDINPSVNKRAETMPIPPQVRLPNRRTTN